MLVQPSTERKLELDTDPYGSEAPFLPGITWIFFTQPSRPWTPLFLMKTTCPAVISVCGPMNHPVPIHIELSAAVISSDACARHG